VLIQLHGACVLGLGLVAISAAQFEYADPRSAPCIAIAFAQFGRMHLDGSTDIVMAGVIAGI